MEETIMKLKAGVCRQTRKKSKVNCFLKKFHHSCSDSDKEMILKISQGVKYFCHQIGGRKSYAGKAMGVANSDLLVRICAGKVKRIQEHLVEQDGIYFCIISITIFSVVVFNDHRWHQLTIFDF